MTGYDCLVVGAGFTGAVCAERLASAGHSVLVIDKRAHVGGNAFDEYDQYGILVHRYGAHIFHTNSQRVWEYLSQFTTWRPYEHRVLSCVNGCLLPVPINQTTLEAFGGDLEAAQRAMVEPYTRKQWAEYADQLSPTVLARIRPRESRDGRYFTDRYQAMPADGYTAMFQRMLDHSNIRVELNTVFQGGYVGRATIYTGPIDQFFGYRLGSLPYRSARFCHVTHPCAQFQSVGVVNYPSADVAYTRVIEFKHLTGQQHQQTSIALEYPCADGEPYWPVPTAVSAELYKRYAALAAKTPRVYFVGRLGRFSYLNMDQAVAQALKLVATLLNQEQETCTTTS